MNPNIDPQIMTINGQPVLVLTNKSLQKSLYEGTIKSIPIGSLDILHKIVEVLKDHQGFLIGFVKPKKVRYWIYLVLLQQEGEYQRVHIERLTCKRCNWQGWTANPMILDLYVDVPDWKVALDEAATHTVLPCPVCTAVLPRNAIWIEPISTK